MFFGGFLCRSNYNRKKGTVIDVTSLLRLWSCRINHNISATQMQPYGTDGRTDRLTNTLASRGLEESAHALRGLEEPFFQLCCCVSFWLLREIGFGCTYWVTAKNRLNFRPRKFRVFLARI
jgi:hypothetical protein